MGWRTRWSWRRWPSSSRRSTPPGLGPARKARLVKELGGVNAVRSGPLEALMELWWLPEQVALVIGRGGDRWTCSIVQWIVAVFPDPVMPWRAW